MRTLKKHGVSDKQMRWEEKRLLPNKTLGDFAWKTLHEELQLVATKQDFPGMRKVYWDMLRVLEIEGKDTLHIEKALMQTDLNFNKSLGFKRVVIVNHSEEEHCEKCQALIGKEMSIQTALKTMPLPACKNCQCQYEPA